MKRREAGSRIAALAICCLSILMGSGPAAALDLPWREAGLTEAEAAAHLIDRLTFGPRPGEIEHVVKIGLETWLHRQLDAADPDVYLSSRLAGLWSLNLDVREFPDTYPNPGMVLREATEAGILPSGVDPRRMDDPRASREARRTVMDWARDQGYRSQRVLVGELMTQKLYRALYSENQLQEVLIDFWFNHFNVSLTDNQARVYVLSFERDAIRPHVLGDFDAMLTATARHPAMLLYLDNAQSTADPGEKTTMEGYMQDRGGRYGGRASRRAQQRRQRDGRPQGLNENYARELLELHTLGVDGGYSQDDVVEVARAFTGWTVYPPRALREPQAGRLDRALSSGAGFYAEDGFLFRADAHDAGKKKVLGKTLAPGRGVEDGEEVLQLLGAHPSTARHLATKLATRFVSDEPQSDLVDRLARVIRSTEGDLRQVMEALMESPEFWDEGVRHQKIKSPFELTVSALRVLDAEVIYPRETVEWIDRMGQPLYSYQAPTGYPDRADFWVNSGALLNRMNFGLALAAGEIDGVEFDLAALNGHREPASRPEALRAYVPLLLPERDPSPTIAMLEPMVLDSRLSDKVDQAAPELASESVFDASEVELMKGEDPTEPESRRDRGEPMALEQVVGVILGSPEFQRR